MRLVNVSLDVILSVLLVGSVLVQDARGEEVQNECSPTVDNCGERTTPKVWKRTKNTLSNFEVAGVNLAAYGMEEEDDIEAHNKNAEPPFELFHDYDIGDIVLGKEDWWDMNDHKKPLLFPSISFFKDKVAMKRWFPSMGYSIPKPLLLAYASELSETGDIEEEKKVLRELLAKEKDYVAKPSHKFLSKGVWVVSHDRKTNTTSISIDADKPLEPENDFHSNQVADSLAENLHDDRSDWSSLSQQTVQPGVSIEERYTAFDWENQPALEFKVQVIWGRVHVANWRLGGWRSQWWPGVVSRDGTMIEGSEESLPEWVDWDRVVDIAERLGAHKDSFRVDLFVGVPASSPALQPEATEEERLAAVEYVVNEVTHFSLEPLPEEVLEESTRLWIAGYKIGNYRVVPNTEVPPEFREPIE